MVAIKLTVASFLASAIVTSAFPHYAIQDVKDLDALGKTVDDILKRADIPKLHREARANSLKKRQSTWSPSQLVDVTGEHRFIAPTSSQTRGPCPGLNVLSNHGYFARSGNTNLVESINALVNVYNMGVDTATVLAAYSVAIIGNPLTLEWSIGRSPGPVSILPGLLSPPGGLSQSHNNYESDASVTRRDAFLNNGDVWSVGIENFKHLYSLQPNASIANYDQDILIQHRTWTLQKSISTNPRFFFTAFPGLVVSTAAHNFVAHFFANHSAERPEGYLDQSTLKSFFSIKGDTLDTLTWVPGQERIPDNWYKPSTSYTLVDVVTGVLENIRQNPDAGKVGGNTGTVNSFTGVDLGDLTGGVFNAANLLEGNNLICFALAAARQGVPTVLGGVVSLVGSAVNLLNTKLAPILPGLGCPEVGNFNLGAFSQFPGSG